MEKKSKKTLTGKIVSDKMLKTVVVAVEMPKKHPVYKKVIRNTKRFKARNETDAKLGDVVTIEETRPYSRQVTWKVTEIVELAGE